MNISIITSFQSQANFWFAGVLSIAKNLAVFFGFLILIMISFDIYNGIENLTIEKIYFLIYAFFLIVIFSAISLSVLRYYALRRLKKNNNEIYKKFWKLNEKEKHKVLGSLLL